MSDSIAIQSRNVSGAAVHAVGVARPLRVPGRAVADGDEVAFAIGAGAVAGVAGAWAMTQFHVAVYGRGLTGAREPQSHRPVDRVDQDATMKAAAEVAGLAGRTLSQDERRRGGVLVHYAFGATVGAAYALLARFWPAVRAGGGMPFGALVWLLADEIGLPAAGLAHGPRTYRAEVHVEMLAAHLVFGRATDAALDVVHSTSGRPEHG